MALLSWSPLPGRFCLLIELQSLGPLLSKYGEPKAPREAEKCSKSQAPQGTQPLAIYSHGLLCGTFTAPQQSTLSDPPSHHYLDYLGPALTQGTVTPGYPLMQLQMKPSCSHHSCHCPLSQSYHMWPILEARPRGPPQAGTCGSQCSSAPNNE